MSKKTKFNKNDRNWYLRNILIALPTCWTILFFIYRKGYIFITMINSILPVSFSSLPFCKQKFPIEINLLRIFVRKCYRFSVWWFNIYRNSWYFLFFALRKIYFFNRIFYSSPIRFNNVIVYYVFYLIVQVVLVIFKFRFLPYYKKRTVKPMRNISWIYHTICIEKVRFFCSRLEIF